MLFERDLWVDAFRALSPTSRPEHASQLRELMKYAKTSQHVDTLVDFFLSKIDNIEENFDIKHSRGYRILVMFTEFTFPPFGSILIMQAAAGELLAQCQRWTIANHETTESLSNACLAKRDMHAQLLKDGKRMWTPASEVAGKLLMTGASSLRKYIRTWHGSLPCEICAREKEQASNMDTATPARARMSYYT
jgi:hypothetical protein